MSAVGFAFIVSLGLLHIYAGRLSWIESVPKRRWLSFGAGVSIAYVFVDILPLLSESQQTLASTTDAHHGTLNRHVYLVALGGLAAFYALELLAKRSRAHNRLDGLADQTSVGVCWVHVGSFALYNALLGYLLRDAENHSMLACALLFLALALHFIVNDYALRSHHKILYDRFGRWLLAGAVVGGYLVGTRYMVDETSIAVIWAFVAGGLILNVIKDEVPEHRDTSLGAFLTGMTGYAALLVVVAH
jgi:hypothetical protein